MTDDTPMLLWRAIDDGDDTAYAALEDYYLERGLDLAAAGVRRAAPTRRRPYKPWRHSDRWSWCDDGGKLGFRSAVPKLPPFATVEFPVISDCLTDAWEFAAHLPEPARVPA